MRLTTGLGPVMKIIGVSLLVGVGVGLYLAAYVLPV